LNGPGTSAVRHDGPATIWRLEGRTIVAAGKLTGGPFLSQAFIEQSVSQIAPAHSLHTRLVLIRGFGRRPVRNVPM
jgi:hypothetical protein